ncbi:MAG: tetratricopeptide repeat protein, partial [Cyclobacteriaceae bacterium]
MQKQIIILLILFSTIFARGNNEFIKHKIDSTHKAIVGASTSISKDSIITLYEIIYKLAESNNLYDKQIEILISKARIANVYFDLTLLNTNIYQADSIFNQHASQLEANDRENLFFNINYFKGIYMNRMYDFQKAIEHFQMLADKIKLKTPQDSNRYYNILAYTADCYSSLQNHHKSLEIYLYAKNFISKGIYHDYYLANNYSHLGELFNAIREVSHDNKYPDLAKEYLSKAMSLLEHIPDENALLLMHLRLSDIYLSENNLDSALQILMAAEEFYSFQQVGKSDIQFQIGKVFNLKNDFNNAINRFLSASNILKKEFLNVKNRRKSEVHSETANTYVMKGSYSLALSHIQKAITNIVADFDNTNVEVLPGLKNILSESHLLEALKIKGNIWFAIYQQDNDLRALQHSIACFDLAFDLIDKMRNNFQSADYKSYIADKATSIYENAIDVAYTALQNGQDQEKYTQLIYQYLERNKSRLLLQSMASANSRQFAGVPDSIISQERDYLR